MKLTSLILSCLDTRQSPTCKEEWTPTCRFLHMCKAFSLPTTLHAATHNSCLRSLFMGAVLNGWVAFLTFRAALGKVRGLVAVGAGRAVHPVRDIAAVHVPSRACFSQWWRHAEAGYGQRRFCMEVEVSHLPLQCRNCTCKIRRVKPQSSDHVVADQTLFILKVTSQT